MSDKKYTFKEKLAILKRSIKYIEAADRGRTARAVIKFLPEAVSSFSAIYLSGLVVDGIAAARPVSELLIRAAIVCGIFFLSSVTDRIIMRNQNAHGYTFDIMAKKKLWEKVLDLDYAKTENPDTKNKYQNALENFGSNFGMKGIPTSLSYAASSVIRLVTGIVLIIPIVFSKPAQTEGFMGFIQSPWGFLAALVIICGLIAVTTCIATPLWLKHQNEAMTDENVHEAQRVGGSAEARTLYNYRNGKEIRIYGEQQLMLDIYGSSVHKFADRYLRCMKIMYIGDAIELVSQFLLEIVLYGFAVLRVIGGAMTPGGVVQFVLYFNEIRYGIQQASGNINEMLSRVSVYGQVFDFLDIPDDKYKGTIPTEKRDDNEYEFEFRHVYFKYPGTDNYVLNDVNLKWRIGEKMALVGRNGSGKSTLVKLLCRLYDPTEGEITLNGIDIRKYSLKEYTDLFSVVFQDSALLAFSIGENVAADTEYDRKYAEDCVRRAGFSERLNEMPNGLDTCVYKYFDEKGVEISGGEAQKLCLARAVYKGAPFIVLDEPTAALDPISEYDIYTKFNSIVGTRTAVYISHRLSSCRFCDNITVLDKGKIAERGSHEALLKHGGVYAKMWNAQAEYYKDTAGELFI